MWMSTVEAPFFTRPAPREDSRDAGPHLLFSVHYQH